MKKGIIAIDLDGTLLDAGGVYSSRTREYLRRLSAEGYLIVLASGRPYRSMKHIYEDLGCNAPVICYNGSLVFHPLDASFPAFETRFKAGSLRNVLSRCQEYLLSYMAETDQRIFLDKDDLFLSRYFPYTGMEFAYGDGPDVIVEDTFTLLLNCPIGLHPRLKEDCEMEEGIAWRAWSNATYSELYIPSAHKGTALTYIMKQYGIDPKDVYAFGDAENDIPMLDVVGYPYAMKNNRVPSLMNRFPQTKYSVDEDGVLEALSEVIKL